LEHLSLGVIADNPFVDEAADVEALCSKEDHLGGCPQKMRRTANSSFSAAQLVSSRIACQRSAQSTEFDSRRADRDLRTERGFRGCVAYAVAPVHATRRAGSA
jgi:hypothetical protein